MPGPGRSNGKLALPWDIGKGKTPQETSSPVDAEGKRGGGVQIPLCGDTSCSLAGTCLNTKQRILDHPAQSESSEDQVTGKFLAGLKDAICCSGEFSEEVGRGQGVLGAFTVKSCGNIFIITFKHHSDSKCRATKTASGSQELSCFPNLSSLQPQRGLRQ